VVQFIRDGLLFSFVFGPDDVAESEAGRRLTAFSDVILNSLTFFPITVALTMTDECLQPRADEQLIVNEGLGFCLLLPPGYTQEQVSESNAYYFIGSITDTEYPQVNISVVDAAGKTAQGAAESLAAAWSYTPPIQLWSYTVGSGDTIAWAVDGLTGVDGQEPGRVLFVVNDGLLYQMTFTPYDLAQPEANQAAEDLIGLVTRTFRFLP
jgi:hypothetical protein